MAAPAEENHVGNHVGFEDEEDDLEDTEDSDMEEYEDDFAATPVPVVSINPNPNPNPPSGQHNGSITVHPLSSSSADPKESKPPVTPAGARPAATPPPFPASLDDSRRLFQRLWTDDDEIKILTGFLEFTSSRGTTFASHQYDTGPFYEQIKNQLQLDFNKNQLIEKLRRLKKKYRNTAARMANHDKEFSFKSPHERATYEIARRIWSVGSSGVKRSRESDDDDLNPYDAAAATSERRTARSRRRGRKRALETIPVAPVPLMLPAPPIPAPPALAAPSEGVVKVEVQTTPTRIIPPMPSSSTALFLPPPSPSPPPPPIPSIVEETVKGCLSPILKELLNSAVRGSVGSALNGLNGGVLGFGIMGLGPPPVFSFGGNSVNSSAAAAAGDEKWKQQQILELEVYLKRVELVRDQIKSTLEELKSSSEPKAAAAVLTPAAPTPTTGS